MDPDQDHVVHAIIRVNENNFSVCGFETFLTGNKSSDKNLMFLVKTVKCGFSVEKNTFHKQISRFISV
jgi:hypothetical protein